MKKFLFLAVAIVITLSGLLGLSSCNRSKLPKGFKGEWTGQLNRYDRIKLKIGDEDKFNLIVYQSRERYDSEYIGTAVKVSDDVIKLQSRTIINTYNSNRRESDPTSRIGQCTTCFFLKSNGAFSQSEYGLDNSMTYLSK
ncbi:MAG: hypothetical protein HDS18_06520 [Bacteroides sp.]|nr:hypothetical protein [Bacteroides sp.]